MMKMVLYNDIEVKMDKNYTFKIYFGKKNNSKYYFLYNKEIFPEAYLNCGVHEKIIRIALLVNYLWNFYIIYK